MRTRSCIAALLLAAASAAVPCRPAAAQEKDAVTDMARRRFQEGVKFFDQKHYEEARAAFLQAYALKHHPAVLLNLAHSEMRSGHTLEAARHFAIYLRDPPPSATAAEKAEAEKTLAAARSKLGRIQVSVAAGAEVLVDGESMGQAPLPEAVDAAPGNHTVEARLGGKSTSTSVTVTVGKTVPATLSLDGTAPPVAPVAAPPPPATPPPAETPETPPPTEAPKPQPPGEPTLQVSTAGREPFFSWLGHSPVGLLGLGLTGVGLGAGITFAYFGGQAGDNADSVANAIQTQINADNAAIEKQNKMGGPQQPLVRPNVCGNPVVPRYEKACSVLSDDINRRDSDKTFATVGFVAAGVGFGTLVIGYLVSSKTTSKAEAPGSTHVAQAGSAAILPVIGPHESGLQLVGRF